MLFLSLVSIGLVGAYCPGGNNYPGDSSLGKVQLAGINNIDDDCQLTGVQNCLSQTAVLAPGGTYTLNLEATTCLTALPRSARAYIDYQCIGTFTAAMAISSPVDVDGSTDSPVPVSFTFTVPSDAKTDCTSRMRVMVVELPSQVIDPCVNFNYGSAKDFTIEFNSFAPIPSPSGGSGKGIDTGGIIMIILLALIIVYIVVGIIYNMKKNELPVREAVQKTMWLGCFVDFFGLVKEGCMYTKMKIMGLRGNSSTGAYDDL